MLENVIVFLIILIYAFVGVDDAASECDLDDYLTWDWVVQNNKSDECNDFIDKIVNYALTV